MKRVLAIALILLLALTACSGEKNPLLGTWETKVDVMPQITRRLAQESPVLAQKLPQEPFWVTIALSFYADGSYQASVDKNSVLESYHAFVAVLEEEIWEYLQQLYAQENPGGRVEDFLDSLGITREALFEEVIGTFFVTELLMELDVNHEGEYILEDNRLYLSRLGEIRQKEYFHRFALEGGEDNPQLVLLPGQYRTQDQQSDYKEALPISFDRK